ncbi:MAG TPA: excinuclease ABC subunit UvrC, partial [Chthoniobacteraceae bacterium]|nr:excinuclease ABC subunit UvrC [Chthoniobacteraceae bacterium]
MTQALREKPDFRAQLHEVPHKPGVYLMRDRFNRVIYVGKARDLRKRVGNYFMPSRKMTADLKTRALLDSIWAFETHVVNTEPEALLLEGRLIKEYRPRYNISFRDDKRFLLVKVSVREEWPRFRLTRMRMDDGARYFGPFAHAGALRQTMAFLRKKFGVLTFGRGNPTERELKSSTYQVPMKLADITAEQYAERIARACEFMEGRSKEMLDALENEMREAAVKLDFERATDLRNMLDDLRKTTASTRKFTRSLERAVPSSIDPLGDVRALQDALQLPAPPLHMECFDISNISSAHIVASMVCFKNGVADRSNYRRYRIATVKGQNDFASMAEVVRRRYSRVLLESGEQRRQVLAERADAEAAIVDASGEFSQESPAEQVARVVADTARGANTFAAVRLPDLVIVDGGKGQLSSACQELQRLGLHELPIIGLAKEFEEIYRPSRPLPLILPPESGALRLLQRIRDEAHRFANGYHQILMKRRVAESLLDECPGVSQHRKQILLQRF